MLTFITVIHILTAIFLVIFVLVQDSKGDGLTSTFGGGGSNSVLGASGAVNLLVKVTRVLVVVFAITSILLTRMTSGSKTSVIDSAGTTPTEKTQAATPPPAANLPATTGAAAGTPVNTAAPAQPAKGEGSEGSSKK